MQKYNKIQKTKRTYSAACKKRERMKCLKKIDRKDETRFACFMNSVEVGTTSKEKQ